MSDVLRVLHPKLYSNALSVPALATLFSLLQSKHFSGYAKANLLTQLAVFIPCVQIPALMTGRLSYVDIAWPTGLLAMGVVNFLQSLLKLVNGTGVGDGSGKLRPLLISFAYVFQGGRMALGAWTMFSYGHLRKEMQRYKYQRLRWQAVGIQEGSLAEVVEIQKEAFTQALANLGTLSVPLALQSRINAGPLQPVELLGWCLWASSFVWEHTSDLQKMKFGRDMKKQGLRGKVCDRGFWNYSRHPNYFGEWMVWVALALSSVPSLRAYLRGKDRDDVTTRSSVALGWMMVPLAMYICLVHWTGATPAEYYSLQNRPEYAQYIKQVNCFFPGPRRAG